MLKLGGEPPSRLWLAIVVQHHHYRIKDTRTELQLALILPRFCVYISGVGTTFTLGVQKRGGVDCFYDFSVKVIELLIASAE